MRHRAGPRDAVLDLWQAPAYVVVAPLVIIAASTASIYLGSVRPVLALVGLAAAVLMFKHPRLGVIGMVVFWAGDIAMELQTVRLGPLKVTFGDICFGLAAAGVLWRWYRSPDRRRLPRVPRFTVPIALFFISLLFGLGVATLAGDSLGESFHTGLNCLPLLAYFLMCSVYAGRSRTLFNDVVVVTGVMCAVTVLAILLNFEPLIGRSQNLIRTRGMAFDALRVDPPVLRIMCITLLLATFAAVPSSRKLRLLRWPLVAAMLVVQGYSMTRTTWTPLLMGWLVLPLLAWGVQGIKPFLVRAVATVVALGAFLAVAVSGAAGTTAQAMAVRAVSVADDNVASDPSLQDRLVEVDMALGHISEHPLVGIGFPRPYGAYQYQYDPEQDLTQYIPKLFIHNTYLGIWMWFGILGILAVVVLVLYVGRATWHIYHMRYKGAAAPMAVVVGLGVLAVSSAFQTNLIYRPAYFALAFGLACLDVWIAERQLPRHLQVPERPGERLTRSTFGPLAGDVARAEPRLAVTHAPVLIDRNPARPEGSAQ